MNTPRASTLLLLVFAAGLAACSAAERPLDDAAPGLRREAPPADEMRLAGTGPSAELTARVASIDVLPELWYADGAGDPSRRLTVTRHDPARVGRWDVVRLVEGGPAPGERLLEFTLAGDALTMARTRDSHEKVITDFDPPMVVMPAVLRQGEPHTQALRMIVRPAAHPDRVQTQGDATHEITYLGDETVTVPAGRFAAARVRSVLRAGLGPAQVENTTDAWHAPGVGIVAERRIQRVTAMGLPIRSSDEVWVLEKR